MAHNLSNYDLHHVCLYIHKFKPGCKTEVIPSTDEKYITLTVGVPVRTYQDKNGMTKTVFEYLRFNDSYRFMAFSLEKLAGFFASRKVQNIGPMLFELLCRRHKPYTSKGIIALFLL